MDIRKGSLDTYFGLNPFDPMNRTKAIFLDIDGVLQPGNNRERFKHVRNFDAVCKELQEKTHIDFSQYDEYDVCAVYYDWDLQAVSQLKRILETTNAVIVLSSNWRVGRWERTAVDYLLVEGKNRWIADLSNEEIRMIEEIDRRFDENSKRLIPSFYKMRDFFAIHGLAAYYVDNTSTELEYERLDALKSQKPHYQGINQRSIEILEYVYTHPAIEGYVVIDDMELNGLNGHFVLTDDFLTQEDADACIRILLS